MRHLLSLIALLGTVMPAKADFAFRDFDIVRGERWAQSYLVGVIEAYEWANISADLDGRARTFCETVVIDYQLALTLVDAYVADGPTERSDMSVGLLVLSALRDRFPC